MKGVEIRYNERTFIVPAEPVTPILIYQRYGYYYVDLEGWELEPNENTLLKKRFNLILAPNDAIHLKIDIIDSNIASKLINNQAEAANTFPLSEEDITQMVTKFHMLEKLLKKEGFI
ncbi:MAG: hypothetical protein LBF27_16355 [Sphingobacterium sp.]|jgi:hypothetical protein|nr:hypothetical protein [Sphingobacterium sp.]